MPIYIQNRQNIEAQIDQYFKQALANPNAIVDQYNRWIKENDSKPKDPSFTSPINIASTSNWQSPPFSSQNTNPTSLPPAFQTNNQPSQSFGSSSLETPAFGQPSVPQSTFGQLSFPQQSSFGQTSVLGQSNTSPFSAFANQNAGFANQQQPPPSSSSNTGFIKPAFDLSSAQQPQQQQFIQSSPFGAQQQQQPQQLSMQPPSFDTQPAAPIQNVFANVMTASAGGGGGSDNAVAQTPWSSNIPPSQHAHPENVAPHRDLTDEEKQAFGSPSFVIGKIPEVAPPIDMR